MNHNIAEGIIDIQDSNYTIAIVNDIQIEGKDNIGKCFHGDLVELSEDKKIKVLEQNIKKKKIVGILELFSSYKYSTNKKGVERFKFIPLNKKYPHFLVSSKCKSKYTSNIIAVIKFLDWKDTLPFGEIISYLGDIHSKSSIYESILYKNNLIQTKYNLSKVKRNFSEIDFESQFFKKETYRNLTNENIISVDPEGTKDIDDAFHFKKISNNLCVLPGISNQLINVNTLNVSHKNLIAAFFDEENLEFIESQILDAPENGYDSANDFANKISQSGLWPSQVLSINSKTLLISTKIYNQTFSSELESLVILDVSNSAKVLNRNFNF